MGQRKAVTNKLALAYRRGSRKDKSRVLDELVELTGWHRDWARAQLRNAGKVRPAPGPRTRRPIYTEAEIDALARCWRVARCPTGKRLAPMLHTLVPLLRAEGALRITDRQAKHLLEMSAATIDRRLGPERARLIPRGRSHTKPGTLLKSQIPIRTWSEWDDDRPGFVEIDLVGHEGGVSTGEFCFTLTMTDIATGWTINRSVPNKAAIWVTKAIDDARRAFPFPLLGIDSDNGSEFVNVNLLDYCKTEKITFTRSRPGNKNDGAHVEQKNWTHVRELVGYLRFDTAAELRLLNEIWALDGLFTNHLLAQQKLVSRWREGAKVIKRYDAAKTPVERTIASSVLSKATAAKLERWTATIRPNELASQIQALTERLEHLALNKSPAPPRPPVYEAFNARDHPEVLGESTNRRSRRN